MSGRTCCICDKPGHPSYMIRDAAGFWYHCECRARQVETALRRFVDRGALAQRAVDKIVARHHKGRRQP